MPDDDELLKKLKKEAHEDFQFYTNPFRTERERWTVSFFLNALKIEYDIKDLISLEQNNPIDVQFHELNFQIKEITDPHFKRNGFYKTIYKSLDSAKSIDDITLIGESYDISEVSSMCDLIHQQCQLLSAEKYIDNKSDMDLLFYVTRHNTALITDYDLKTDFSIFNFRSVSCINSKQAVVLFASQHAPVIIKNHIGITNISS